MKKTVAVAAAAVVAAGALAVPATAEQGIHDFEPAPIDWGECENPRLVQAGAECGFVEVPMDYAEPDGEMIQLAVSRVTHKGPDDSYQGPMVVNPGGPGGSGLIYSIYGDFVPDGGGDDYDWIGFDPRGVGSSTPHLSCIPDFDGYNRPYYVPVNRQLEKEWLGLSKDYADACEANHGEMLEHMTTIEVAMDLESIRKALGSEQINYYGFSYGTYIGQVYATMFPEGFRRVVFDGVVNPERVWYEANIDQDIGFDRNIKIYFDWLAKHNDVYGLGDTGAEIEELFYDVQQELRREPAGGKIGPDEWSDVFLSAGYYIYGWEDVANAFVAYVKNGDHEPLVELYGSPPFHDNGHAVYLATVCTDAEWETNYRKFRQDQWRTHRKAPFETWGNAWFNGPCLFWPAESETPVDVDGSGLDGALLINETFDAATPYAGALEARKRIPSAILVEGVGGTTHSGSLSGVECSDDIIVEYLKTGSLPERRPGNNRSDVQCEPVPQPDPEASGAGTLSADDNSGLAALRRELMANVR